MVRLILTFLTLLFLIGVASSKDVTVTWEANTEPDLAGYNLYETDVSGQYERLFDNPQSVNFVTMIPAGTETVTITVPDAVVYSLFWTLTAFDTEVPFQESGLSTEVYLNVSVTPIVSIPENKNKGGCFLGILY